MLAHESRKYRARKIAHCVFLVGQEGKLRYGNFVNDDVDDDDDDDNDDDEKGSWMLDHTALRRFKAERQHSKKKAMGSNARKKVQQRNCPPLPPCLLFQLLLH